MSEMVSDIFGVSGSALRAQRERMKVIAENIANANTTASQPGGNPYRRQVVVFKDVFDKVLDAHKVKVAGIKTDPSDFIKKYDPSNPAADAQGYIKMPNVNSILEMMDMGEANRNYEANLSVIEAARAMVLRTISIIQ